MGKILKFHKRINNVMPQELEHALNGFDPRTKDMLFCEYERLKDLFQFDFHYSLDGFTDEHRPLVDNILTEAFEFMLSRMEWLIVEWLQHKLMEFSDREGLDLRT